ncbi:MAG: ATPase, T2SS/T4P/T4SS family [Anaerolineae bacterium]|nr:ATPase, T2SS/T4P/T4SS family [Anaerolineae bacterium]MDW8173213.1 ATPase, T2SS/T4P/T4SS family [Anaerolineae bacterium]
MSDPQNSQNQDQPQTKFVPSKTGRTISYRGLLERIVEQFSAEYGEDHPALLEADNDAKRRALLKPVADYVFAVEAVALSLEEQAQFLRAACSELFTYGGLDALLNDPRVTTISLEGAEKVSVRYRPGEELQTLAPIFEDGPQARRMIAKLVRHAGAELRPDIPVMEVGLMVGERPVNVNVAVPPYVSEISADIRVHPAVPPTLADFVAQGYIDERAAVFLHALACSEHGVLVVGDTESGKTTLLGALAQAIPEHGRTALVERSAVLRLPGQVVRYAVRWPHGQDQGQTFAECIRDAVESRPKLLVLDEIRGEDAEAIAPLLGEDVPQRQIWAFRGSPEARRIRSALGMLARMADRAAPEAAVYALHERLPFVVILKRRRGDIRLIELGEWVWPLGGSSPDYTAFLEMDWDEPRWTGRKPARPLDLPSDFWA